MSRDYTPPWLKGREELFAELMSTKPASEVAQSMGAPSRNAVIGMANRKGFAKVTRFEWTEELGERFHELYYQLMTYRQIGDILGCSEQAITRRVRKLGLKREQRQHMEARVRREEREREKQEAKLRKELEAKEALPKPTPDPAVEGVKEHVSRKVDPRVFQPLPGFAPVPLVDRHMLTQCAWPVGEELSCGRPRAGVSAYCKTHARWSSRKNVQA